MSADDAVRAVLDAIDEKALVDLASTLVKIPSYPGVPEQERAVVRALEAFLTEKGLSVEVENVVPGRPNLYCTVRGRGNESVPHLVLCGHTDTVPPNVDDHGEALSGVVRNDVLYGRGSADMKGALAAMCAALVALEATKSSALPRGSVTLAAVIDEEMKSLGAEHLVESGFRADGAIIGEATENRLALGHKGLEWIEIHFEGKTAHGGKLETGVNAIVAAARYIDLCQRELVPRFATRRHQRLGPPTLNFGTIAGGDQPSTVAGRCRIRLDRRTVPGESWKSVSEELGEIGNRVEKEMPGLSIELLRMDDGMATLEHGSLDTNESDPIARATTAALRTVGADPTPTVFPAWSDAALLSAHSGIPSIVLGPGDLALAHSPNESVSVLQVIEAARIYALTAVHFCSNGNLK